MIKICELHDGVVSLVAINAMLKVAQLHKLGEYVRVYALDALGNPAEMWHRDSKTAQPVTKFPEWGIEFEKGIVCSAVRTPKNPDGPVAASYIFAGRARPFGMEGAIREGWGKPTLRHAIGYLDERYGSQEADAIAVLRDRAALIPESPPDRPAPW
jgi:hypothetical protein